MPKIKLIIYEPHKNIWFGTPVKHFLEGNVLPNKYASLLKSMLSSNLEIYFCPSLNIPSGIKEKLKEKIELYLWCFLNRINLFKVGIVSNIDQINKGDIFFMMLYGNFTHNIESIALNGINLSNELAKINIKKVVHMSHFVYNAKIAAENLKIFSPNLLISENNLKRNSSYFQEFYGSIDASFYTLPFIAAKRFVDKKNFKERIPKLVATGTITYKINEPDFINFYGVNELSPLRRQLLENRESFLEEMDCLISDLDTSSFQKSENHPKHLGLYQKILRKLSTKHPQNFYYKKDIVSIYNDYMMFIVPEEVCDLPAIGFVEGMACGSVFFGVNSSMYNDLGLLPDVHFVAYDGTISDLMNKVRFYKANIEKLAEIAESGRRFIDLYLRESVVYQKFILELNQQSKK